MVRRVLERHENCLQNAAPRGHTMETSFASMLNEMFSVLDTAQIQISAPFRGCSHDVFVLGIPSGKWALRVAKDEFAATMAQRSLAILRHMVQQQPTLAIPAIVHSSKQYAILEYIEGVPLGTWFRHNPGVLERRKVLDGLAVFLYKLWTCPTQSLGAEEPAKTYKEWLIDEVDSAIRRSLHNDGWGDPFHYVQRRARVGELLPLRADDGRLRVKHGDMNALNILVNDGELSG
nr:hypothetical protein CFP56_64571 [Quercus suber]